MNASPTQPAKRVHIHELAQLADGTPLILRDQTPDDRRLVSEFFERLSPRARQLRFLGPVPRISERLIDVLSAVDGLAHVGIVAVHGGRLVGAARYIRDRERPNEAELAFTVADDFRRRGLGRLLVASLLDHAAVHGVERLTADMAGDNYAAHALMRSFGARMRSGAGGTAAVIPVTTAGGAPALPEAA